MAYCEAEGRGMGGAFARPSGGRGVRPKAEEGEGRITQAEGLARGEAYCAVAVIKIKARRRRAKFFEFLFVFNTKNCIKHTTSCPCIKPSG